MSQTAANSLAETLWRKEKTFLMQHYARLLIEEVEADGDLDDKIVESLIIAQPYADADLASRIANLLTEHGHNAPLDTANGALLADEATPSPADRNEEGEESESLYEVDEEELEEAKNLFAEDEEEEDCDEEDEKGEGSLFAGDEELDDEDSENLDEDEDEAAASLFADENEDEEHNAI